MIRTGHRRIVTGLDSEGRSAIIIDGPSDEVAWSTSETPVNNSDNTDAGGKFSFNMPRGGTSFLALDIPPTSGELFGAGIHASNTIDYITVVRGEVVLVTETGEVACRPGDMIVDRGVMHGWRNEGTQPCLIVCAMIDAAPVGKGATV